MSMFLYQLAIKLYGMLILMASPFHRKARLWIEGRKGWSDSLEETLMQNKKPVIWMHCASVGEFEQGRPILERIRSDYPAHLIVLTFFSPSGYELRKHYSGVDQVLYLPLDTLKNARRFIQMLNPQLAIFIKYEYWLNILMACKKANIPCILVSAYFRPQQIFFRWYGSVFLKALRNFSMIVVQDKHSKTLLLKYGINRVVEAGDTRFDRVLQIASSRNEIPLVEAFISQHTCLVAGSTWPADEEILAQSLSHFPKLKYIIVPHEIDRHHINQLKKRMPGAVLYSHIHEAGNLADGQVLILDQIGLLSGLYRYADFAYVGGGFGKGIHNILEAAVYGIPVFFGPAHQKFREAGELLQVGGARCIRDVNELADEVQEHIRSDKKRKDSGEQAGTYVKNNSGATDIVMKNIRQYLNGC